MQKGVYSFFLYMIFKNLVYLGVGKYAVVVFHARARA